MTSHANLATVVVDTLREAIGAEPTGEQIRVVMRLLASLHGELAAYASRADAEGRTGVVTPICAARRSAWLALPGLQRGLLVARDIEEGRTVPCHEMRIPCSCGAKEHEFCR